MQYTTIQVKLPFNQTTCVLAIYIEETEPEYAGLMKEMDAIEEMDMNESEFSIKVNTLINKTCDAIHLPEDVLTDVYYFLDETDSGILLYCIDSTIPEIFIQPIQDNLLNVLKENPTIWKELEFDNSLNKKNLVTDASYNCYLLEKLSDLYHIPPCSGSVIEDTNGVFYLITYHTLDDFLTRTKLKENEPVNVVVDEVDRIYQTMMDEQER